MSPKKDLGNVIKLPRGGVRKITVDGTTFTMDFDDARLLRNLLDMQHRIEDVVSDDNASVDKRIDGLLAFSQEGVELIDAAFGEGAAAKLFGADHLPIVRVMALITKLAELSAPVYDTMFADYKAN